MVPERIRIRPHRADLRLSHRHAEQYRRSTVQPRFPAPSDRVDETLLGFHARNELHHHLVVERFYKTIAVRALGLVIDQAEPAPDGRHEVQGSRIADLLVPDSEFWSQWTNVVQCPPLVEALRERLFAVLHKRQPRGLEIVVPIQRAQRHLFAVVVHAGAALGCFVTVAFRGPRSILDSAPQLCRLAQRRWEAWILRERISGHVAEPAVEGNRRLSDDIRDRGNRRRLRGGAGVHAPVGSLMRQQRFGHVFSVPPSSWFMHRVTGHRLPPWIGRSTHRPIEFSLVGNPANTLENVQFRGRC